MYNSPVRVIISNYIAHTSLLQFLDWCPDNTMLIIYRQALRKDVGLEILFWKARISVALQGHAIYNLDLTDSLWYLDVFKGHALVLYYDPHLPAVVLFQV